MRNVAMTVKDSFMNMHGCIREMKAKVGNVGGMGWAVGACLFADDMVLFAENE